MLMLRSHLQDGVVAFYYVRTIALIVFCAFTVVKFLVKRKYEFKPFNMLCEFVWILTVLMILKITGIIGGNYRTSNFLKRFIHEWVTSLPNDELCKLDCSPYSFFLVFWKLHEEYSL